VVLSSRVNRPGRKANQSLPPTAQFKNEWSYSPTPPYAFTASTDATLLTRQPDIEIK